MSYTIELHRLLTNLSLCLDFCREGVDRHHQRVAYISLGMACEIGLTERERDLLFSAAVIHDAGASTWGEKQLLAQFEIDDPWEHCQGGYQLVNGVDLLKPMAEIILSHHDKFDGKNKSGLVKNGIPLAARIIHLADRIDILIKQDTNVLLQQRKVIRTVEDLAWQIFDPDLVAAFRRLARRESFWLELCSPLLLTRHLAACSPAKVNINEKDLKQIAWMFAAVIDKKSPFTHCHSRDVSRVAARLAAVMGFNDKEVSLMEIAGLLHDIGKLSVPEEILEKPSSLTAEEYAIIRQHSFYTYRILEMAGLPAPLPGYAAYHHEKLDGSGYPFHLSAPDLSPGARIMAVADVFVALREDRPYRLGKELGEIEKIMYEMVLNNALDGNIVKALFKGGTVPFGRSRECLRDPLGPTGA